MWPFLDQTRKLTPAQKELVETPLGKKIFLSGIPGTGKTTVGVHRLAHLLEQEVPANSILLLLPKRSLANPYLELLASPQRKAGGEVSWLTIGGLARRMIDLFWPVAADQAGFAHPERPPIFLTLETAQFYMASLVEPLIEQGAFQSLTIDRNRLYSQIIDNLNKAAVVGFPVESIAERLKSAWIGEPEQLHLYEDVQNCSNVFRQHCLEHNLLDFSIQIEIFYWYLWRNPLCRDYLHSSYRHLIFDNLEEDTPVAHDLLREWLPDLDSALLINDNLGGYRRFMGADPSGAEQFTSLCDLNTQLEDSFIMSAEIQNLQNRLTQIISGETGRPKKRKSHPESKPGGLKFESRRFFPAMLDWVSENIAELVNNQGVPPGEIVVLSPFVSDSLRFSLTQRLEAAGVPTRSHRPSRSLKEEPVTHCLLTLALLAHPQWLEGENRAYLPNHFDCAYTLVQAIQDLDLVRAQLLASIVYRTSKGKPSLSSFEQIQPPVQERITYWFGDKYDQLRQWLEAYQMGESEELDHFLARLFGEVLSQPGFGFHQNYTAGEITANLIESIQKFRWAVNPENLEPGQYLGLEYYKMLTSGVIAAQFLRSWQAEIDDAVLLAPAYTYLMSNRPVDYQFWLDIGSRGWSERLYQPLTHPYILSRQWPADRVWTDVDEVEANREAMIRLIHGLFARCRRGIYLGLCEVNEQGYEQKGPLLMAFQRTLQELRSQ